MPKASLSVGEGTSSSTDDMSAANIGLVREGEGLLEVKLVIKAGGEVDLGERVDPEGGCGFS